ncbi:MAG: sugar phosphate isomerase/epimerase family protein [Verrucomicrobiota bacterium]
MKSSTELNRREFLQRATLGVAALGTGLSGCATLSARKKIPVGLELYSVRTECKADFRGTLEKVSKIGYRAVEFAGYWGLSAKEVRQLLDDNGLITCSTHTQYADLQPAKLEATLEFNHIIGNKLVICPYMTGKSKAEWLAKADEFNRLAEALQKHGMRVGYHAHKNDFTKFDGESAWDIFFGHTRPEVIMQLDTSNCRDGGADPVEVLHQYPGRARSIHIKPNGGGPEAVIGEDKINWPGVFEFCEGPGRTEWYVVEHETSKDAMATVKRTFEVLQQLGKV